MCEENDVLCNVIGVPKSIDNDILLIDKCFGFDTAVEEAQRALLAAKVCSGAQQHANHVIRQIIMRYHVCSWRRTHLAVLANDVLLVGVLHQHTPVAVGHFCACSPCSSLDSVATSAAVMHRVSAQSSPSIFACCAG
jgi:hypothetical protein